MFVHSIWMLLYEVGVHPIPKIISRRLCSYGSCGGCFSPASSYQRPTIRNDVVVLNFKVLGLKQTTFRIYQKYSSLLLEFATCLAHIVLVQA